jgi:methylenetetrahydrofolate reductase (NADPH)
MPSARYEKRTDGKVQGNYPLSRVVHKLAFTANKGLYPAMSWVSRRGEAKKGVHRGHHIEHLGKVVMYGCQDCGDCGLHATAYICPMSQCPKCQRNGPCGGSSDGWCEVYPGERYCIYYKAYHRLKKYGDEAKLDKTIWPPVNWDFFQTSAWSNYHHGRDNIWHGLQMPKRPEI